MALLDSSVFVDGRALVEPYGVRPSGMVYRNLGVDALYQAAVQRGQAQVMASGALLQDTRPFLGRAARSSFYVNDPALRYDGAALDELMSWGDPAAGVWDNLPISPEVFARLRDRVVEHLSESGDLYVNDGYSGRTPATRLGIRVVTDRTASALFAHNIFNRVDLAGLRGFEPGWTILHAPDVEAEKSDGTNTKAFIITDLASHATIIGGTRYHGQIKKAIFCVQSFRLPLAGILTLHAGASDGDAGLCAIHAGLSGTGKTVLSNTGIPVADDQVCVEIHAAGGAVVSNMEGGQYAKTGKLRREKEPETYDAIGYGTTAENIWVDEDGVPDYSNLSLSANGRVGYPLEYVHSAKASGTSGAPANITFLTADGYGVLPPLARLSEKAAMFHFAAGFTSKMPGTERGVVEPLPTFSSFFGKPFMPLKPVIYMDLLGELMETHGTQVWLVNTGWLGPARPGRERVDLWVSKAIITAVRDGEIDLSPESFWHHPVFKVDVPRHVPGVPDEMLDPRNAWDDQAAYRVRANQLATIFEAAIGAMSDVPADVAAAGPRPVR